ncbi:Biotin-protein ligase / Biotin operon repressor [Streptococcus sp. DD10]|uniref:bifunctional biotin--[acetyl-CoA-carboxylase] ligase/biotin operon repressor BirA n=1 Tax=Streptococcus sp. DD10 TaxID=1777878 RepID=UPI00079AA58D|nr:bifunctional biotin--[acetyl-CoA-carboxylase] ligase/biotin operon repressor BirA [Streptococcus sp. DD10]KXT73624.1 Biotin-protein ligase / Biotin operon repressor [Streptococcus sp. DD10]
MKTYQKLYEILAETDDYMSGESIAQNLQISRTSVWKAIQRLEKEGLIIQSVRNKGYKLIGGDLLLASKIEELAPIKVSINSHCQSTQLDAKRAIEQGGKPNTLYLAPFQSAGRGRFGRSYYCPPQGGIYMSLHLKPNSTYQNLPSYTLLVAGAIYKAIKDLTLIDVDIKWVNDIYYRGKKIGGILTEAITNIETGLVTDLIIGVGLNLAITDFPVELKDKAGSLFISSSPITRNELIGEIWKNLYHLKEDELLYLYQQRSLILGRKVSFTQNQQHYEGIAKEITDTGQLRVQLLSGQDMWLNSGEISLDSW